MDVNCDKNACFKHMYSHRGSHTSDCYGPFWAMHNYAHFQVNDKAVHTSYTFCKDSLFHGCACVVASFLLVHTYSTFLQWSQILEMFSGLFICECLIPQLRLSRSLKFVTAYKGPINL